MARGRLNRSMFGLSTPKKLVLGVSRWVLTIECVCTCGFQTDQPRLSVMCDLSVSPSGNFDNFDKCSHHRLHTKSSEMKGVVHVMQQWSTCLGSSAVEHQSSKWCLDILAIWNDCRLSNFGGGYCVFLHLSAKFFGFSVWGPEEKVLFFCLLVNCPFFSPLLWLFY